MKEVTTITIDRNDAGDTLRVTQVTDRDRSRSKADVRSKKEVVRIERDTVYVAVRDSVCPSGESAHARKSSNKFGFSLAQSQTSSSTFVSALKWIFWILVAGIVLIVILRFGRLLK